MTANFGPLRVPLQGAMVGGEGEDQLWGSGHGASAGCHCRVPLLCYGGDQLWGRGRGAIAGCLSIVVCYGWGEGDNQL